MKSWIPFLDDSTEWRRVVLHRVGAFAARLLLFGSVFLFHPGERCVYETGGAPAKAEEVLSGDVPQAAADVPVVADTLPPTF